MSNEEKIEIYKDVTKNIKKLQTAGVRATMKMGLQDRAYYFTAEKLSQFKKKSEIKALNPGREETMCNSITEEHRAFTKGLEVNVSEKKAIKNIESTNKENEKEEEITK